MSFMRQGTWMMFSNTFAGLLMFGVHLMAPAMMGSAGEYGLFVALLGMLHLVMSLAPGIQTVFAHESAAASTPQQRCVVGRVVVALLLEEAAVLAGLPQGFGPRARVPA